MPGRISDGDWDRLSAIRLPAVFLLAVPDGDAAWDAGVSLARAACDGERSHWHEFPSLSAPDAREIVRLSNYQWDHEHVLVIRLDSASSPAVIDILLKSLEEPPGNVIFVLTQASSFRTPATIVSRASQVYRAAVDPESVARSFEPARQLVVQAVQAASANDQGKLARLSRDWTVMASLMLGVWAAEVYTGRWSSFSLADGCGYGPGDALRVMGSMAECEGAGDRIAMRVALGSLPPR